MGWFEGVMMKMALKTSSDSACIKALTKVRHSVWWRRPSQTWIILTIYHSYNLWISLSLHFAFSKKIRPDPANPEIFWAKNWLNQKSGQILENFGEARCNPDKFWGPLSGQKAPFQIPGSGPVKIGSDWREKEREKSEHFFLLSLSSSILRNHWDSSHILIYC